MKNSHVYYFIYELWYDLMRLCKISGGEYFKWINFRGRRILGISRGFNFEDGGFFNISRGFNFAIFQSLGPYKKYVRPMFDKTFVVVVVCSLHYP